MQRTSAIIESLEPRRLLSAALTPQYVAPTVAVHSLGTIRESDRVIRAMGTIDSPAKTDYWAFSVEAGAIVTFDVDTPGEDGLDSAIKLFDANRQPLSSTYITAKYTYRPSASRAAAPGEAVSSDPYLVYWFKEAGTYYLGVSSDSHAFGANRQRPVKDPQKDERIGGYALEITTPRADYDDQISEAIPLGTLEGTPLVHHGAITAWWDVDVYSFAGSGGDHITIDLDTPVNGFSMLDTDLRLFDSTGKLIKADLNGLAPDDNPLLSAKGDSALSVRLPADGIYYIGVASADNGSPTLSNTAYNILTGAELSGSERNQRTGTYTLRVYNDIDDQIGEAVALPLNSIEGIAATLSAPDDVDFYRFEAEAGQHLAIDVDFLQATMDRARIDVYQFDARGRVIRVAEDDYDPRDAQRPAERPITEAQSVEPYLEFRAPSTGTYFLAISDRANRFNPETGEDRLAESAHGTYRDLPYRIGVFNTLAWDAPVTGGSQQTISGIVRLGDVGNTDYASAAPLSLRSLTGAIEDKPTWILSHGRESAPAAMTGTGSAVETASPGWQVLLLDWSVGAADNPKATIPWLGWPVTIGLQGAWIERTAEWVAATLEQLGISGNQTALVGHSWGSFVAHEIAERQGRARALVALDPAARSSVYEFSEVSFSAVAMNSWAFYGNGILGSPYLAATARESHTIVSNEMLSPGTAHTVPVTVFSKLIAGDAPESVSRHFQIDRLLNPSSQMYWLPLNNDGWRGTRIQVDDVSEAGAALNITGMELPGPGHA